jgi:HTH-type transcriptional regulator/antitoxin HipB
MSQRVMAEAIGVGKSTIGQAERDGGTVTLPVLLAALALGGIELQAIDRDGEVSTMRLDELRDRGNRKLPAHLRAWVASESENVPHWWRGSNRKSAPVRWSTRPSEADSLFLPTHHPVNEHIVAARRHDEDVRAFREARMQALRRAVPSHTFPLPACTCSDECVATGMACPPTCPCQCEGPQRAA